MKFILVNIHHYCHICHCVEESGDDGGVVDECSDPLAPLTVKQTATLALLFGIVVSVHHHITNIIL